MWLSDPDEARFTRVLLGGPRDQLDVAGYIAFLRGKGDPRGELLELVVAGDRITADDPAARARIAELRDQIDPMWVAVIAPHWLLGCGEQRDMPARVRFSYQCPRIWAELAPTPDPNVRSCDGCGETVHRCATIEDAEVHARAGHCISVPDVLAKTVYKRFERRLSMITGRPSVPEMWLGDVVDPSR